MLGLLFTGLALLGVSATAEEATTKETETLQRIHLPPGLVRPSYDGAEGPKEQVALPEGGKNIHHHLAAQALYQASPQIKQALGIPVQPNSGGFNHNHVQHFPQSTKSYSPPLEGEAVQLSLQANHNPNRLEALTRSAKAEAAMYSPRSGHYRKLMGHSKPTLPSEQSQLKEALSAAASDPDLHEQQLLDARQAGWKRAHPEVHMMTLTGRKRSVVRSMPKQHDQVGEDISGLEDDGDHERILDHIGEGGKGYSSNAKSRHQREMDKVRKRAELLVPKSQLSMEQPIEESTPANSQSTTPKHEVAAVTDPAVNVEPEAASSPLFQASAGEGSKTSSKVPEAGLMDHEAVGSGGSEEVAVRLDKAEQRDTALQGQVGKLTSLQQATMKQMQQLTKTIGSMNGMEGKGDALIAALGDTSNHEREKKRIDILKDKMAGMHSQLSEIKQQQARDHEDIMRLQSHERGGPETGDLASKQQEKPASKVKSTPQEALAAATSKPAEASNPAGVKASSRPRSARSRAGKRLSRAAAKKLARKEARKERERQNRERRRELAQKRKEAREKKEKGDAAVTDVVNHDSAYGEVKVEPKVEKVEAPVASDGAEQASAQAAAEEVGKASSWASLDQAMRKLQKQSEEGRKASEQTREQSAQAQKAAGLHAGEGEKQHWAVDNEDRPDEEAKKQVKEEKKQVKEEKKEEKPEEKKECWQTGDCITPGTQAAPPATQKEEDGQPAKTGQAKQTPAVEKRRQGEASDRAALRAAWIAKEKKKWRYKQWEKQKAEKEKAAEAKEKKQVPVEKTASPVWSPVKKQVPKETKSSAVKAEKEKAAESKEKKQVPKEKTAEEKKQVPKEQPKSSAVRQSFQAPPKVDVSKLKIFKQSVNSALEAEDKDSRVTDKSHDQLLAQLAGQDKSAERQGEEKPDSKQDSKQDSQKDQDEHKDKATQDPATDKKATLDKPSVDQMNKPPSVKDEAKGKSGSLERESIEGSGATETVEGDPVEEDAEEGDANTHDPAEVPF